ncbi:hypothetical protein OROHE_014761 [Orobanche hederae]
MIGMILEKMANILANPVKSLRTRWERDNRNNHIWLRFFNS